MNSSQNRRSSPIKVESSTPTEKPEELVPMTTLLCSTQHPAISEQKDPLSITERRAALSHSRNLSATHWSLWSRVHDLSNEVVTKMTVSRPLRNSVVYYQFSILDVFVTTHFKHCSVILDLLANVDRFVAPTMVV